MLRSILAFVLAPLIFLGPSAMLAQEQSGLHSAGRLDLLEVQNQDSLWIYQYRITNISQNRWAISGFFLDLSAPSGTRHRTLPATGPFRDWHGDGVRVPSRDHVPVGPISPETWGTVLRVDASLLWYGTTGGVIDNDSIAPGTSLAGFGLRSPYLPGTRQFWAEPTWQACCSEPGPDPETGLPGEEHPGTDEFRQSGWTVGPTRAPDEMSDPYNALGIVLGYIRNTCDISWITNPGICNSLRTKLEQARRALERGNNEAATGQLQAFLNELEAQRGDEPGKHVNDNAYWLLKVNVEFILERIGDDPAVVRR